MPVDISIKVGDIKGESTDAKHKDEIDVLSWSWGLSSTEDGGGGQAVGRTRVSDLTFAHRLDKASPRLMAACATGKHLATATLSMRRAGIDRRDFLVVTMADVLVTSVATSAQADLVGEDDTVESVSLTFAKVTVTYHPQKPDGSLDAAVEFTWNARASKRKA